MKLKLARLAAIAGLQACALSGCYLVPVGSEGNYAIYIPTTPPPSYPGGAPQPAAGQPAMPKMLHARLYPENDIATQTGMVSGTVTNMMTGKGRFQVKDLLLLPVVAARRKQAPRRRQRRARPARTQRAP